MFFVQSGTLCGPIMAADDERARPGERRPRVYGAPATKIAFVLCLTSMKVMPIHNATCSYVKRSVQAFLEGAQGPKWISGVLQRSGLTKQETMPLLLSLENYGLAARSAELREWLNTADW